MSDIEKTTDLRPWGYAPGGYRLMKGCPHCGGDLWNVDKRASSCKPCAEAAREKHLAVMSAPLICDEVCNVSEA